MIFLNLVTNMCSIYSLTIFRPKFEKARQRIAKKYDEIERELIDEFVKCHQSDNRSKMKEVAGILSNFKVGSKYIAAFNVIILLQIKKSLDTMLIF